MAQRAGSEILRRIGDDPALLGTGLQWVRGPLPLRDQLQVDAVLRDPQGGAILLLAEDDPRVSLADLTARLVLVHGEVRASRALLGELLEDRGLTLSRLMVVLPRAPDALLATAGQLQDPAVEVRSIGEVPDRAAAPPADSEPARELPRSEGHGPAVAPDRSPAEHPVPTPQPAPTTADGAATDVAEGVAATPRPASVEVTSGQPDVARTPEEAVAEAPPPPPRVLPVARSGAGPEQLLAEAKRRILRVSDAVEAEVDGALTRYRMREELLAVLEEDGDGGFHLHVGRPLVRRAIRDARDLAVALDEILARFVATDDGPGERRVS